MNILVTGVSKGLGLQITKSLLTRGWTVFGISRNKTALLNELLHKYPANFYWHKFDLADVNKLHNVIFKEWIGIDTPLHGFVNNAALAYDDIITNLDRKSVV